MSRRAASGDARPDRSAPPATVEAGQSTLDRRASTRENRVVPQRILVVIGTRPEAIKLAPLVRALEADPRFVVEVCASSQHGSLLHQMLGFFALRVDHDLQVMRDNQSLAGLTARLMEGVSGLLERGRFDVVVVQGDTSTAFVAALAAFYARVPVAHVEAGLRSGDLSAPFPEEANRRLADVLSRWLFAPTTDARQHLLDEGYPSEQIFVTGNTGIDALLVARDLVASVERSLPGGVPDGVPVALLTAHRRESFGEGLTRICRAARRLVDEEPALHLLYPVHPNPHVRAAVEATLADHPRIHLCAPLDYPDFVCALSRARLVMTDSGGVQEEAPALGRKVLVLRETTERPEGVAAGVAELVGTDEDRIVSRGRALLAEGEGGGRIVSPYGDGRASARIVEVLATGALGSPFSAA
jgi:UDP-N-acetylglucosamine 2-epimerase (non-hydrolysing)